MKSKFIFLVLALLTISSCGFDNYGPPEMLFENDINNSAMNTSNVSGNESLQIKNKYINKNFYLYIYNENL